MGLKSFRIIEHYWGYAIVCESEGRNSPLFCTVAVKHFHVYITNADALKLKNEDNPEVL